ncbi:DUF2336 domain-containing protein [Bradyrhizobium canariense]|uniref:Uncharacterized conserved protein, DUF2336 family n=1 Tax=Bradyrhizobium canariense TaxID=255045 RepID=A0A1H1ZKX9_9BRAD|nr:DUF2336 domain-containing protein [Bradyrhizobium canariense]SDT34334.1 Uncharacterized conserved protein, DUF2336 family [Bradyrhizobium canariense]
MTESTSFLTELEEAVSKGTAESCLRALWHATDVLIAGRYSEDQIWTFGEVIGRLAEEIEHTARVRLSNKLAPSSNAPFDVIKKLAFDDSIDVAGPVLRQSERIDSKTLVANARCKSQQHLLAISKRKSIPDTVTDVLVVRGSAEVASSVAKNGGARFSGSGFLHLLKRSEDDSILAEQVGMRKDIPRHLFQQLISKASDDVRRKLGRERPDMGDLIQSVVTDVTGNIHAKFGPASKNYFAAKRTVGKLHQYGELNEDKVFEFAHSLKFNETAVSLSLLCNVPIDVVERALVDVNREAVLILAKALNFSWSTTMSLLFLGAPNYRITAGDLDRMKIDFQKLNVETSKQVLTVYRSRKEASTEGSALPSQRQA